MTASLEIVQLLQPILEVHMYLPVGVVQATEMGTD